jgi:hypothetical protein
LNNGQLTPPFVLVLFIVSVIAVFWALDTLIRFRNTERSAGFVSLVDFCFFGAFIAGVYELGFIGNANCVNWDGGPVTVLLGPFGFQYNSSSPSLNKTCAMLKTSFAFGIMELVFFFFTAVIAYFMFQGYDDHRETVVKETVVRRRSHSSRRGHSNHSRRGSSNRRDSYV